MLPLWTNDNKPQTRKNAFPFHYDWDLFISLSEWNVRQITIQYRARSVGTRDKTKQIKNKLKVTFPNVILNVCRKRTSQHNPQTIPVFLCRRLWLNVTCSIALQMTQAVISQQARSPRPTAAVCVTGFRYREPLAKITPKPPEVGTRPTDREPDQGSRSLR